MKGLYKRHETWWLRFTPAPGAKQKRVPLDTTDEAEALVNARAIKARLSSVALADAEACEHEIEQYLNAKHKEGLSASTLQSRKYVLKAFAATLKAPSPRLISRPSVQRWYDQLAASNPHTATAYLSIIRYWFKWLMESGRCTHNPATQIKVPKLKKRRRKSFLLPDQARKLLDAAKDPDLKFAIYCGLHAGMRKNEIIEARPDWFDLESKLIHIQHTETFSPKDRDNRTVPMTDEFREWLLKEFTLRSPFVMHPEVAHGKYRYRYDFRKAFDSLVAQCDLEITFHDLRRTFASLLVSRGVSLYKVAKWLGDTLDTVEETYGHLIPQDDEINSSWK